MLYFPHALSIRFNIPPFLSRSAAIFISGVVHLLLPSSER